jgi:hypothetical protein
MYSRTILLAAASLAVTGMADAANAALSDPHFVRGHYVARSINPSGRVVLAEINPKDGALIGEILI